MNAGNVGGRAGRDRRQFGARIGIADQPQRARSKVRRRAQRSANTAESGVLEQRNRARGTRKTDA